VAAGAGLLVLLLVVLLLVLVEQGVLEIQQ
jgi:hypothetical protein